VLTVTGSVAVTVVPLMVTAAVSVRDPFAVPVVSQVYQSVVPVAVCVVSTVPSTDNVNVLLTPHVAVVAMPTVWPPLTVAPEAG
jgi:hypothetical protein